jgi:hypothetical protein
MSEQAFTFNEFGADELQKENIEWLNIWCEDTNAATLPRVALVGDSITQQSFQTVQKALKGLAHVDYFATSYSLISPTYEKMLTAFLNDSKYDVVCYNYGLHGYAIGGETFEKAYRATIEKINKKSKIVISLTTCVRDKTDLTKMSKRWENKVQERNLIAQKVAREYEILVDDLFSVSMRLGAEGTSIDGVHFNDYGKERIAESKAEAIKKILLGVEQV